MSMRKIFAHLSKIKHKQTMSSKLGDLPGFGRAKENRSNQLIVFPHESGENNHLDTTLESLLGGGDGGRKKKKITSTHRDLEGDDFYKQMADDISDEEVTGTYDHKQFADSLDVENMDANLFGSFNKKKKKPLSTTSKNKSTNQITSSKPPMPSGGVVTSHEQPQESGVSQKGVVGGGTSKTTNKPISVSLDKRDEDLDDILDLLADDDTQSPAKSTKPKKIPSVAAEPHDTSEGNPITYKDDHGELNSVSRNTDSALELRNGGRNDALKFDNKVSRTTSDGVSVRPPAPPKVRPNQINFDDDDDDDILSGLGLEDSKGSTSHSLPITPTPQTSLPSSQPTHTSQQRVVVDTQTRDTVVTPPLSQEGITDTDKGEEEDTFQFGGYVPTVAESSPKSALGRRRGKARSDSLALPSATVAKKTVRFSDDLVKSSSKDGNLAGKDVRIVPATQPQDVVKPVSQPASGGGEKMSDLLPSSPVGITSPPSPPVPDDDLVDLLEPEAQPPRLPEVSAQQDESKGGGQELKLEHPVFPWQKSKVHPRQSGSSGRSNMSIRDVSTKRGRAMAESGLEVVRTRTEVKTDIGKERAEALQKVQETEAALEKEKAEHNRAKELLSEQVREGAERLRKLEEELTQHRDKVSELEEAKRKVETDLKEKYEECKVQLFKVELERDQLQQLLETSKQRQQEEIEALLKSHNLRLTTTEDSFARREGRWKEELETEGARWREKVEQAEREKTDAVLALRRKLDSLEVSRTNEISRLQSVHRSSVEDLKREHETDRQHLIMLHSEEMEAVKAAHSHTRMLGELNSKVEASAREVSQLQAKLSDAHSKLVEERAQRNRTQEDHLKVLEQRLVSQQTENQVERGRLQTLVSKLEAHIAEQSRSVEQERWQLQQETTRLKAQQAAFQEERTTTLGRLEEQRRDFQSVREKFLVEQQEILTKCYEEQRVIASERAQVSMLRKKAEERAEREKVQSIKLTEESARVLAEKESSTKLQEAMRVERKSLDTDREKLEVCAKEIQRRSEEMDTLCRSSFEARERGEQELLEAKKLKDEVTHQSSSIQSQMAKLREKEQHVAAESLSLAERRRTLQREIAASSTGRVNDLFVRLHPPIDDSGGPDPTPDMSTSLPSYPGNHFQSLQLPPHDTLFSSSAIPPTTTTGEGKGYSPRTSPSPGPGPDLGTGNPCHVQLYLAEVERKKNLRQIAAVAEKDYEDLRRESEFLASLETMIS